MPTGFIKTNYSDKIYRFAQVKNYKNKHLVTILRKKTKHTHRQIQSYRLEGVI